MSEWDLPIAEHFHSFQGEGQWVGTPMHFIRLAGCNVGKPARALKLEGPFPMLPSGREAVACTSWDGRSFPCDTDYNKTCEMSAAELFDDTWERHICVTGGEPLLHIDKIETLFGLCQTRDIQIHIETSGTIIPKYMAGYKKLLLPGYWVTVAPKINAKAEMICRANELKLLVDEHFDRDRLTIDMLTHPNVFLCPINEVDKVSPANIRLCEELTKSYPQWRISIQLHKLMNWR